MLSGIFIDAIPVFLNFLLSNKGMEEFFAVSCGNFCSNFPQGKFHTEGNHLRGNCPEGKFPRGQLSSRAIVREDGGAGNHGVVFLGVIIFRGNCPGAVIWEAIFPPGELS